MGSGTQTLLTQVAPPLYPVAAPAVLSSNTGAGAATAAVAPAATVGDRFTAGEDETAAPAEAVTVAPAPVTSADKTSAEMGSGTQTLLTQVAPPL
jgi:hypothetical protein